MSLLQSEYSVIFTCLNRIRAYNGTKYENDVVDQAYEQLNGIAQNSNLELRTDMTKESIKHPNLKPGVETSIKNTTDKDLTVDDLLNIGFTLCRSKDFMIYDFGNTREAGTINQRLGIKYNHLFVDLSKRTVTLQFIKPTIEKENWCQNPKFEYKLTINSINTLIQIAKLEASLAVSDEQDKNNYHYRY